MLGEHTVETPYRASLRIMMELLEKRDSVFLWEAAFALKIKTNQAKELLTLLVKEGKAEQFNIESTVKECTGMGCVGCDCTNSYVKKEIKYRLVNKIS